MKSQKQNLFLLEARGGRELQMSQRYNTFSSVFQKYLLRVSDGGRELGLHPL